jgi:hypothetical protein
MRAMAPLASAQRQGVLFEFVLARTPTAFRIGTLTGTRRSSARETRSGPSGRTSTGQLLGRRLASRSAGDPRASIHGDAARRGAARVRRAASVEERRPRRRADRSARSNMVRADVPEYVAIALTGTRHAACSTATTLSARRICAESLQQTALYVDTVPTRRVSGAH